MEVNETHGIRDTTEAPCGACQTTQKVCQRKQNLINVKFVGQHVRQVL